jgi:23S rRNA pseudouridine1911/1915/1917 synthase
MSGRTVTETIPDVLAGERADRVVAMLTGLSRREVAAMVDAGAVRVDGKRLTTRSRRLVAGEVVEVDVPADEGGGVVADPDVEVQVVYADGDVIVVDKPAGLVVHPGAGNERGTMVHGLLARYPELAEVGDVDRPGVVHRLDKGTSGLLVVARSQDAYDGLVAQLAGRSLERRYTALVWGTVDADAGLVDAPLARGERDPTRIAVTAAGKEARTRYEVVRRLTSPAAEPEPAPEPAPLTLLDCRLETGRTHQIRAHLAAIGHPVVGDDRYGGARPAVLALARPFLHARLLAFDHPRTGERMLFESPLPPDLAAVLTALSPQV